MWKSLFHDRILVVAGPKSKWARRRKVELSELADEPWVLPPHDSHDRYASSPKHSVRAA